MSSDNSRMNGNEKGKVNQLIISFDVEHMCVHLGGTTANLDIALAMLDMARRALEGQMRAEEVRNSLARPLIPTLDLRGRQ